MFVQDNSFQYQFSSSRLCHNAFFIYTTDETWAHIFQICIWILFAVGGQWRVLKRNNPNKVHRRGTIEIAIFFQRIKLRPVEKDKRQFLCESIATNGTSLRRSPRERDLARVFMISIDNSECGETSSSINCDDSNPQRCVIFCHV